MVELDLPDGNIILSMNVAEESTNIVNNQLLKWGQQKSKAGKPRILALVDKLGSVYIYKLKSENTSPPSYSITRTYSINEVVILNVAPTTFSLSFNNGKSYNWTCPTDEKHQFLHRLYKSYVSSKIKLPRLVNITELELRKLGQPTQLLPDSLPNNITPAKELPVKETAKEEPFKQELAVKELKVESDSDSDDSFPKIKVNLLSNQKRKVSVKQVINKHFDSDEEPTPITVKPEQVQPMPTITKEELAFYSKMDDIHLDSLLQLAIEDKRIHSDEYAVTFDQADLKIESILKDYLNHLDQRNLASLVILDQDELARVIASLEATVQESNGITGWLDGFERGVQGLDRNVPDLEKRTVREQILLENLQLLSMHLDQELNRLQLDADTMEALTSFNDLSESIQAGKLLLAKMKEDEWEQVDEQPLMAHAQQRHVLSQLSSIFTSHVVSLFNQTSYAKLSTLREVIQIASQLEPAKGVAMATFYAQQRANHYKPMIQEVFNQGVIARFDISFQPEKIPTREKTSGLKTISTAIKTTRKDLKQGMKEFGNTIKEFNTLGRSDAQKIAMMDLPRISIEASPRNSLDKTEETVEISDLIKSILDRLDPWMKVEAEFLLDFFKLENMDLMDVIFQPTVYNCWMEVLNEVMKRDAGCLIAVMSLLEARSTTTGSGYSGLVAGKVWEKAHSMWNEYVREQTQVITGILSAVPPDVSLEPGLYGFIKNLPNFISHVQSLLLDSPKTRVAAHQGMDAVARTCVGVLEGLSKRVEYDNVGIHVVNIENMHHVYTQLRLFKIGSLDVLLRHAKSTYDASQSSYTKLVVGKSMQRMIELLERVEDVLRSGHGDEVQHTPSTSPGVVRETLGKFTSKDMRKLIEGLKQRVFGHFSRDEEGLKRVVFGRVQEEVLKTRRRMEEILKRCYPGMGIALDFTESEVIQFFNV
jgi:hypothetical protein